MLGEIQKCFGKQITVFTCKSAAIPKSRYKFRDEETRKGKHLLVEAGRTKVWRTGSIYVL